MHHLSPKAMRTTRTATLGELLEEGWLDQTEHTPRCRTQCTDAQPIPTHPGGYAECLRCELLTCLDPRQELRRASEIEIATEAQVMLKSYLDLARHNA